MKSDAVIFDLDGTIVDTGPAQHLVRKKPKDFHGFHLYGSTDALPNEWVANHARQWSSRGVSIIYVSGRPAEWEFLTTHWLRLHGLPDGKMYMRSNGDHRPDDVIKKEIYDRDIDPSYRIIACYDDRPRIIRMWRSLGLHVVDVGTWPSDILD